MHVEMIQVSAFLFVFFMFAKSQVLPNSNAVKKPSTLQTLPAPSVYPFKADRKPLLGINNYPYYNPTGPTIPIVSYSDNRGVDGSYAYSYSSADGKQVQESGFLKDSYVDNNGNPQGTQVKEGGFAYVSPEGTPIQINYVADENGFRPAGFRIPADGKGVVPNAVDRVNYGFAGYDKYTPFNYQNGYNNHKPYNGFRPYDLKYPNGFTNYPFSTQYRPLVYQEKPNAVTPKLLTA